MSARRHLTRHFFRAIFDLGVLTTAGADALLHMLLGAIGGLVALGLLMTYLYLGKYVLLWHAAPDVYRRAVAGDDLLLVALPMLLVAFTTLLVSHALFPDERDLRILGPLPLRRSVMFTAKLAAVARFSGLLIGVTEIALLPLVLLTSIDPTGHLASHAPLARVLAWVVASTTGSAFAMLAIAAIVGAAALVWRERAVVGVLKSALLLVLVVSLPFVLRLSNLGDEFQRGNLWLRLLPPTWFVGVEHALLGLYGQASRGPRALPAASLGGSEYAGLAGHAMLLAVVAIVAITVAAAIVAIVYSRLFRDLERLVRPATAATRALPRLRRSRAPACRDRERLVRPASAVARGVPDASRGDTPAFRAVREFVLLTLRRSPLHQGVLVGVSAAGLGLALHQDPLGMAFGLMFICGMAMRAALALPMTHQANWIFRMTEDPATRREQLRAVDRLVMAFVIAVPIGVAAPMLWRSFAPSAAASVTLVAALGGLVFVHLVLIDWRRIPFTCSYLPGKRFIASSVLLTWLAFTLFILIGGWLARAAAARLFRAAIIVIVLGLAGYVLRRRRLAAWSRTPLLFEDDPGDRPLQLQL